MSRDEILAQLRERIVAFAASRMGRDTAEDIAQETLILLEEKYADVIELSELLPLSLQIVRFKMAGARRKSVRRGESSQIPVDELQLPSDVLNSGRAGTAAAVRRTTYGSGAAARRTLPRAHSSETIGKELCRDSGTLWSRVHQHGLHVGCAVPEEPAGPDGRKVGRMTDDVRKLLGGYATGTLTDDEKKVLFDAALHDDALFAALADEHALKEMLDDSSVRAQVLQATEEPRFSVVSFASRMV